MIRILARNRLTHTRSTPNCKACNCQLAFSLPSYLIAVRVEIPNTVPRTFTVHVCPECNKLDDAHLIDKLVRYSVEHYDDLFAPDYMKHMNRIAKLWSIKA